MQVSAHASLGMIYIVFPCLGMSYSSKIRPVLYDASILPIYRGIVVICSNKVAMEKMAIIITFAPALIKGLCIGYVLADHSWINCTR